MGKGNRNRQFREETVEIVSAAPAKKKKTRVRKPLSPAVKRVITYAVTILLLVGALVGILAGAGTFKRANIVVKSKTGDYDLNQQMATYIVWSSAYYEYYYNWQYYMTSEDKATFNNALNGGQELTASQYALYAASNLVQNSLRSAFESFESSFRSYVAACDVAEELGYSRASVSRAVNLLAMNGDIVIAKSGEITLTEAGEMRAHSIYERHELITRVLTELGADAELAEDNACRIEHVISDDLFALLKRHFEKKDGEIE